MQWLSISQKKFHFLVCNVEILNINKNYNELKREYRQYHEKLFDKCDSQKRPNLQIYVYRQSRIIPKDIQNILSIIAEKYSNITKELLIYLPQDQRTTVHKIYMLTKENERLQD